MIERTKKKLTNKPFKLLNFQRNCIWYSEKNSNSNKKKRTQKNRNEKRNDEQVQETEHNSICACVSVAKDNLIRGRLNSYICFIAKIPWISR